LNLVAEFATRTSPGIAKKNAGLNRAADARGNFQVPHRSMPLVASIVVRGGKRVRSIVVGVDPRGLISVTIAVAICLSAISGLLMASSCDTTDPELRDDQSGDDATRVVTVALKIHDPIVIVGNAGFTNASGVV